MADPKPFNKALLYILILLMIITGSINTIFNKILQKLKGKGILFEQHHWIITFGMFTGELVSIFFYIYIYIKKRKSQKGEILVEGQQQTEEENQESKEKDKGERPPVPTNLIFAITATCDLMGSTINTFGLTYLTTSMFQMMRGLELFFVCLWSTVYLKNPLYRHAVLGISSLIFGLSLVGLNAILNDKGETARNPPVGIILLCISQIFSSTEYVIQEKFIKQYDVHPFQLVGFEGLWGMIMYTILLVIFQFVPCDDWSDALKEVCFKDDEGNFVVENTIFAFKQMWDNKNLLIVYIFYVVSIALYNIVGINLTKLVSSTARAVVDTVRTVFIWLFFLLFTPVEGTKETFHVLQLIGFLFVVLGTLIYNEIISIPLFNLDYYTRDNIAKREKEKSKDQNDEEEGEGHQENRLVDTIKSDEPTDPQPE
jgi:drug/metabolite transporter (DMT)-like permease